MKFLWQTCVSSSGTTLDIAVKYRDAGGEKSAGVNNKNFLPDDGERDIVIFNGVSNPNFLSLILRNCVKGPKMLTPAPGSWSFSTDMFITPYAADSGGGGGNRAELPLATGLAFAVTNPDCVVGGVSTIPKGCVSTSTAGCNATSRAAPQPQKLFEPNTKLCSTTKYAALDRPCGESVVFEYVSSREIVTTVSGIGQPCGGGAFYLEVKNSVKPGKTVSLLWSSVVIIVA